MGGGGLRGEKERERKVIGKEDGGGEKRVSDLLPIKLRIGGNKNVEFGRGEAEEKRRGMSSGMSSGVRGRTEEERRGEREREGRRRNDLYKKA
eukprot:120033-Prorocentrum_minimum.AAC.1